MAVIPRLTKAAEPLHRSHRETGWTEAVVAHLGADVVEPFTAKALSASVAA